jgi:hypothetical protein
MGVVDYAFYTEVYKGTDADEASFPALCARACDIIGAATHWVDETTIARLPALYQTLYKKAICAQVDFLAINGIDSVNETASAGFTVGKVTVHGKAASNSGGALSESVSPLAIGYLEQTGLMNPQVPTLEGWW